MWVFFSLFNYSPKYGHFGCFQPFEYVVLYCLRSIFMVNSLKWDCWVKRLYISKFPSMKFCLNLRSHQPCLRGLSFHNFTIRLFLALKCLPVLYVRNAIWDFWICILWVSLTIFPCFRATFIPFRCIVCCLLPLFEARFLVLCPEN